jgi:hypothetical protein
MGFDQWALLLFPDELSLTDKTGHQNSAIQIDAPFGWVGEFLGALAEGRNPDTCLLCFCPSEFRDWFHWAVKEAGLQDLDPELYSLPHGGVSHDMATKKHSLLVAKPRGRWASDQMLRRYEKHGMLQATVFFTSCESASIHP